MLKGKENIKSLPFFLSFSKSIIKLDMWLIRWNRPDGMDVETRQAGRNCTCSLGDKGSVLQRWSSFPEPILGV